MRRLVGTGLTGSHIDGYSADRLLVATLDHLDFGGVEAIRRARFDLRRR